MFRIDDKHAVITGAGSGIGKAVALVFAKQGAIVHVLDVQENAALQTVNEIISAGGRAQAHVCDVTNQQQVTDLFNSIAKVDILVNSAGISHIGRADNTS